MTQVVDIAYQAYLVMGGDPSPEAYMAYRQQRRADEKAVRAAEDARRQQRDELLRKQNEERRRLLEQQSAAEVPGFHARTTIDDTLGKLYALRCQLRTPIPADLDRILDEIEELADMAVDMALDPDAERTGLREDGLLNSGSENLGMCSCGAEYLGHGEPF